MPRKNAAFDFLVPLHSIVSIPRYKKGQKQMHACTHPSIHVYIHTYRSTRYCIESSPVVLLCQRRKRSLDGRCDRSMQTALSSSKNGYPCDWFPESKERPGIMVENVRGRRKGEGQDFLLHWKKKKSGV